MLFPNLAEQAVERAKSDYYRQVMGRIRKGRALAVQYYNGQGYRDYEKKIDKDLREQIPRSNNNLVKRIIERVSQVYTIPPVRTIDGEPADKYTDKIPDMNTEMQNVERYGNLLNLVAVKPTAYGEGADKHIELDLIIDFDVFVDPDDPLKAIAIVYPLPSEEGKPEHMMYIDAGGWVKYDLNGKVVKKEEHNYGLLPVYFHYTEKPMSDFWDVDYARDLVDSCRTVNVLSMDRTANVRFQSYGYVYASGTDGDDLQVGQNKVTTFRDPQAKLDIVTPPDTQDSTSTTINNEYKAIARNWHLPEDFVTGEGGVQAESGVARKLRSQELNDDRKGDLERCRKLEDGVYIICQSVYKIEFNIALADGYAVDFRENEISESEDERRLREEWEVDKGFKTWAHILIERNPDKFADEADPVAAAQEFINENKRRIKERGNLVDEILGGDNGGLL